MTPDRPLAMDPLSLSHEGRIDAACDRYEAAWKTGGRPRIEAYLDAEREAERPALFRQLLALELELRGRQGERTDPDDYLTRFPEYTHLVEEAFRGPAGRDGVTATATTPMGPEPGDGLAVRPPSTNRDRPAKRDADTGAAARGEGAESAPDRNGAESRHPFTETHSLLKSTGGDKQFGRYRLLRVLGQGAFGRVHLAFDEELQRQVAIKVPTPDRFQNPGDAELYLAEARIVADARPSQHRPRLRRGPHRGWLGLRRLQVHRGPHARRPGRGAAGRRRSEPARGHRRPGTRPCSSEAADPPRREARQHPDRRSIGYPLRGRLRSGDQRGCFAHRTERRRHAGLHESRTGPRRGASARWPERHLLAGRRLLRAADRQETLPGQHDDGSVPSGDLGRSPGSTCPGRLHSRRAGADLPEGHVQARIGPIRDRDRAGGRPAALAAGAATGPQAGRHRPQGTAVVRAG